VSPPAVLPINYRSVSWIKCILILAIIFLCFYAKAQFPNPALFNTGTNGTGTGTLSYLSQDLNWTAALSSSVGTYTPALVVGSQPGWSNSPFTNATWIVYPHTCYPNPAQHFCDGTQVHEYYRLIFNLPSLACGASVSTPSAYCMSLDFMADNCVTDIHVNGALSYSSAVVTPSVYAGFSLANKVAVSLCNNWVAGSNTIIVHVVSGAPTSSGLSGFLAQANQTLNTTVGQPVSATSTQSNPVCFGGTGSATVVASGGTAPYTYSWIPAGGTGNVATGLSAGNYTCVVTSSNLCSFSKTLSITQPTPVNVLVTATSPTPCISQTVFLNAFGSGGIAPYTFTWIAGPSSSVYAVTASTPGIIVYTVTTRDANNCASTGTISVNFTAPPFLSVTSASVCSGASGTLTATGATSYTWLPGNSTNSVLVVSPVSSTNYTVSGTLNGCNTSTIASIFVSPPLMINIIANSATACVGNLITLTGTVNGGTPAYSYSWTAGPSTSTRVVSPANAGNYSYSLTVLDLIGCSVNTIANVSFFNGVSLTVSPIAICPGATGTLSVSGANTYTWLPSGAVGSTFTDNPTAANNYTVSGTSLAGCVGQATTNISLFPAPTLSFNTYSITCGSLGSATVMSTGGSGPFNYTWNPTAQTGSTAAGLFPGTYSVSVFDQGTGCVYTPTTNFLPLVPLTGTVTSTPRLVCPGDTTGSASIVLSGGSGSQQYSWSNSTGALSVSNPTTLAAGIHTVTVTDLLTFCLVSHTFNITQPPIFTLNISASSPSVCMGDSILIIGSNSGGTPPYSYTWTNQPSGNSMVVKENFPGTFYYNLNSTDSMNCNISKTVSLLFVPNPTITTISASICPLQNAVVSASGAATYSWSAGVQQPTLIISPSVTTVYSVVGTASACSSRGTATVVLLPTPTPVITGNSPICNGDTLVLSGSGGVSYHWTGPSSFSSTLSNNFWPAAGMSRAGIYQLKVTAMNGCTASASASVVINPIPLLVASGATVCEGNPIQLFANYLQGATYFWSGSIFSSTVQSPVINNAVVAMTGQYSVTIFSSAGCHTSSTVPVSVVQKPVPVISGDSTSCVSGSLTLNGSGGGNYSWNGPLNFYSVQQNINLSGLSVASSGFYTLNVSVGPCKAWAVKSITVFSSPVFSISANSPVCENQTLNFFSNGLGNYAWYGPASFTSSSTSPNILSVQMQAGGTYTAILTDNTGCKSSKTVFVKVLEAPKLTITNHSVCIGGITTLTVGYGDDYTWLGPGNFTATGSVVTIPVTIPSSLGLYTVIAANNNSCTTVSTISLTGLPIPLPDPKLNINGLPCVDNDLKISANGGKTYWWSGPNNFHSTLSAFELPHAHTSMAGNYTVTVTDTNGCTVSRTLALAIYKNPIASILFDKGSNCVPFCKEFKIVLDSNAAPLKKSTFQTGSVLYGGTFLKYCVDKTGDYPFSVFFIDTNNCIGKSSFTVSAYEKPIANFEFSPPNPLAGIDRVHFYDFSRGVGIINWSWYFDGTDSVNSNLRNPDHIFEKTGKFPVVLEITNKWGCKDTAISMMLVEEDFTLYVPDVFSRNGDGLNDIFLPKGTGIETFIMEIYDRWGERIFETSDFYHGWDGYYKDKPCKPDIYIWKIRATGYSGIVRSLIGHVMLEK
jgi:gliding motility-associated-like protein